ncbi:hypothetical protein ACGFZB_19435 [Streptomyces cinerochromogenes]|uniref:Uncharacterized protein n=1 Tax=Streptomyces cinerochromogenes TaxID=66422 RepID=A0ABW7B5Z9_9ACTN
MFPTTTSAPGAAPGALVVVGNRRAGLHAYAVALVAASATEIG